MVEYTSPSDKALASDVLASGTSSAFACSSRALSSSSVMAGFSMKQSMRLNSILLKSDCIQLPSCGSRRYLYAKYTCTTKLFTGTHRQIVDSGYVHLENSLAAESCKKRCENFEQNVKLVEMQRKCLRGGEADSRLSHPSRHQSSGAGFSLFRARDSAASLSNSKRRLGERNLQQVGVERSRGPAATPPARAKGASGPLTACVEGHLELCHCRDSTPIGGRGALRSAPRL